MHDRAVVSQILECAAHAMFATAPDGTVIGWSRGACQLLGYSSREMMGARSSALLDPDGLPVYLHSCNELLRQDSSRLEFDASIRSKSGVLLSVHWSLSAIRFSTRTTDALLHEIAPLTVREPPDSWMEQLGALGTLLDSVPMIFAQVNNERRYVYMNRTGLRLAGMEQVKGMTVREQIGEEKYEKICPQIDQVLAGIESFDELPFVAADGSITHYLAHRVPKREADGTISGYYLIGLDITQSRVYQEELLHRERRLRETLVRDVHHRIKNALQGLVGLMRLHAKSHPEARCVIDHAISQLMAIASAFGLASRHGESQILLCDLVLQIASDIERQNGTRMNVTVSPEIGRQEVVLAGAIGPNVSLIINELLFNALKHGTTTDGSNIVRVRIDRDEKKGATVCVINEAGSLPPGFDFDRGAGLGTGLSLVRALVSPEECHVSIEPLERGVSARLSLLPAILASGPHNPARSLN
jgi:PAS domain S-box-containing protein